MTVSGNRNFTVATGTSGTHLTVARIVSDGTVAGNGITKSAPITMVHPAANTYTGATRSRRHAVG